jgi:UDP-3-O-[3-hydroxymyristoyl] glucosamine N-acyltransferase
MNRQIDTTLGHVKKTLGLHTDVSKERDDAVLIKKLASLDSAQPGDLTYCTNRLKSQLGDCRASVIILSPEMAETYEGKAHLIRHAHPELAFTILLEVFYPAQRQTGIDPSAVCAASAQIDPSAWIQPGAVIMEGAAIAAHAVIGANSVIGCNVSVGEATRIHPNVTIYDDVVIGASCIIHSGARIGVDGFGYSETPDGWKKMVHIGTVVIGDNVEIGANTCVDRGMLDNTEIHKGTKIDNLVHIAHNVVIGEHGALAGCSAIAGSTKVGKNFRMGGGAGLNGQIRITDNVVIGGATNVMSDIQTPGFYIGVMPTQPQKDWARSAVAIRRQGRGLKKTKESK